MMKFSNLSNTILYTSLILGLLYFTSCKKENYEVNYQAQAQAAENLLFAKHNVIQLTISYFKAITDSSLNTLTGTHIDGGWTVKTNTTSGVSYNFRNINNNDQSVGDDIGRERYGIMRTLCDTLPLTEGSQTSFEFIDFGFSNEPYLTYAQFPILSGAISLELVSVNNNLYEFEQNISNLQFTDSTGNKTITLEGSLVYEWEKEQSTEYFSPDNEHISIKEASLSFRNHTGDDVEMELTASSLYPVISSKCGILKSGEGNLNFTGQSPSAATFNYQNVDTVCNIGARMEMDGMDFRLTIDDWVIR